jgi:hypothetical protein
LAIGTWLLIMAISSGVKSSLFRLKNKREHILKSHYIGLLYTESLIKQFDKINFQHLQSFLLCWLSSRVLD